MSMDEIIRLATQLAHADAAVAAAEVVLKQAKSEASELRMRHLPRAVEELGGGTIRPREGLTVEVNETIVVSPKKENRTAVLDWFIDRGMGDLLKNTITLEFGRGDRRFPALLLRLREDGFSDVLQHESTVHHQTLQAYVRHEIAAGRDVPMDLLGVVRLREAVVKREEKVFDGE